MIRMRHQQPNLWETFFAEEVAALWDPWMRAVDELLDDNEILEAVYVAQGSGMGRVGLAGGIRRQRRSLLRMLILKHVRNWSYETLEREVRANVVGMEKVPDAKTLVRLG